MTRPAVPAAGCVAANVASSPMPGAAMPKQFGPISRMPCLRQTASRSALPAVSMPAVNTTSPRTPRAPQASATSVTAGGGTAISARSGVSGRLATSGKHGTPPIPCVAFGLTAYRLPW